ncbi:MAG: hypothetical protein ACPG21_00565 [Crocinitomicaceae bacterium]
MKRLLFSSSLILLALACGTSEESVSDATDRVDSTKVAMDTLNGDQLRDTTNAIIHGTQDQEKLDSIKNAKNKEKKKK